MRFRLTFPLFLFSLLLACQTAHAQKPQLTVQTGHANYVDAVALSRDAQMLASGGDDNTVRLWDTATGTELRTLAGHTAAVFAVAFSPDDRLVASGSADKTIILWDVASGAKTRTLTPPVDGRNSVYDVVFSPDGKSLYSAHADGRVRLWDVASGAERNFNAAHADTVLTIALSADGRTLAAAGRDKTIKLWDVAAAAMNATKPTAGGGKALRTLAGHTAVINRIAFSADAKTLASGAEDGTLRLWRVADGKEIRTLTKEAGDVLSMALSPDDKTLASGSWEGKIFIWDVATGKRLHTFQAPAFNKSMVYSADGKTLITGSGITITLLDAATGAELRSFTGRTHRFYSAGFTPDGKSLLTRSASGGFKLWDTTSSGGIRTLAGAEANPSGIIRHFLSGDGRLVAQADKSGAITIVDVASGKELRTLAGHTAAVVRAVFSPDARRLASASGGEDGTLRVWDVATGKESVRVEGFLSMLGTFAFDPRGERIVYTGSGGPFHLREVAKQEDEGFSFEGHEGNIEAFAFSPDGKIIASGSGTIFGASRSENLVKLWDAATGKELRTLAGHTAEVNAVAFSPDGKMLASASSDNTVKLWNVTDGKLLHTLAGHEDEVNAVGFSPDGKIVSSASQDTRLKLWEAATGRELASLVAVDERDWLVVTPDGLFDGSPAAWGRILWRFSPALRDVAPVELFFNEFYYPGLLAEIFADKRPRAAADIAQKDRRQPGVRISTANASTPSTAPVVDAPYVQIKVEVSEADADETNKTGGGAQDVRLFRNGTLVKLWRGDVLKGNPSATLEERIPIVAGENRFTAYAFNRDNVKSADAALVVNGAANLKRPAKAYVLAVGINTYANSSFNLKYAVADAEEFGREWQQQQKRLGRYAETVVVPLLDAEATKANILLAIKRLVEVETAPLPPGAPAQLERLKYANPEDAVVVYFAGHGTAQQSRFYLIPHDLGYAGKINSVDAAGLELMLARSVSDRELEEAFERLNAGQLLMVLDACNSGQALEAEEKRRGPMNSKGLAQLAYEKGMYILTAAQSFQAAQEVSQLGHGLLTYALVEEGLRRGAADAEPPDGTVTVREWLDFATVRVPEMQFAEMQRALARGLDLSFIEEERGLTLEQRNVQRPRVFYRRELETNTLLVAKTAATPAATTATPTMPTPTQTTPE